MSFKNAKHLKTTIAGIVTGLLIIAGFIWPDKITPDSAEELNIAADQIITGVAGLIALIAGIMAKDK